MSEIQCIISITFHVWFPATKYIYKVDITTHFQKNFLLPKGKPPFSLSGFDYGDVSQS